MNQVSETKWSVANRDGELGIGKETSKWMWNHRILLFHLPEGNPLGNTDYDIVETVVQQTF